MTFLVAGRKLLQGPTVQACSLGRGLVGLTHKCPVVLGLGSLAVWGLGQILLWRMAGQGRAKEPWGACPSEPQGLHVQ